MRFPRLWLIFLFSLLCGSVAAQEEAASADRLAWRCWYDGAVHVSCFVESVPAASATPALVTPGLPQIVHALRTQPAAFRGRLLHIPLHSLPYNMDGVAVLAQAIVCGQRTACSVRFTPTLPEAELAAFLATWDDPILAVD